MDYIQVGKIINTHGIKGEVKVHPLTYDINRFKDLEIAYLGDNKIKVQVERVKYYKDLVIIKFKEFNNISEVLDFRGLIIYSNTRGKLNKNEFYYESLYDLEVYNVNDNSYVGKVTDIVELPHGKLLEIYNEDKKILTKV